MSQQLKVADLTISSPAFETHGRIPDRHSSTGEDLAPELRWSGAPSGTKAFAVVVHRPRTTQRGPWWQGRMDP